MSKKYPRLNDKAWLIQKYWEEKLSHQQIAQIVGCGRTSVWRAFKAFNISCRSFSEAGRGEKNPMFGKHHSEEANQKNRLKHLGKVSSFKGKHHSEAAKAKQREARKHRIFPTHHTKIEMIFEEITEKKTDKIRYTGDGSFWIETHKGNINPDFIVIGKKIAIEVNGEWTHYSLLNYKRPIRRGVDYRRDILKKVGWKLIVFWESDLKRKDAEQFILSVLRKKGIIK